MATGESASGATAPSEPELGLSALALGALGVVYGDIGTSPLYALRECFGGEHAVPVTEANVLGVLSLVVWALILVIVVELSAQSPEAPFRLQAGRVSTSLGACRSRTRSTQARA
jgi:KUP system potassium uptake protein